MRINLVTVGEDGRTVSADVVNVERVPFARELVYVHDEGRVRRYEVARVVNHVSANTDILAQTIDVLLREVTAL